MTHPERLRQILQENTPYMSDMDAWGELLDASVAAIQAAELELVGDAVGSINIGREPKAEPNQELKWVNKWLFQLRNKIKGESE